jgi:MFS family permease
VACVYLTLRSVAADEPRSQREHIDLTGTALLSLTLVGLVFGLSQTQGSAIGSMQVVLPVALAVVAGAFFVMRERRASNPLMSLTMLRRRRNYLGATISQALAGMAEMGLGVIFPLLLILNLGMSPALAGVALAPATLPMIVLAPMAGRWYDRAGGRPPLAIGFGVLAVAGLVLAWGALQNSYQAILPGLLLYGIGLALVLTVNDPVSLDSIPEPDQGQASGVAATAEQGGGAIGIAVLYAMFHAAYVGQLHERVDRGPLPDLTDTQYEALRADIEAAEQTGLHPQHFDPAFASYLVPAREAAAIGYATAFLGVTVIAILGLLISAWLVRRPPAARPPELPRQSPVTLARFVEAGKRGRAGAGPRACPRSSADRGQARCAGLRPRCRRRVGGRWWDRNAAARPGGWHASRPG